MRTIDPPLSVGKITTEIDGFDLIANGGLPQHELEDMEEPLLEGTGSDGSRLADRAG